MANHAHAAAIAAAIQLVQQDADDETSYGDEDEESLIMMAAIANGMYLQALSVRALSTCPKFSVFKNKYSLVLTGLFNFNIEMSFCRLA